MKSERTKQCGRWYIIFSIVHFLCLFGPFIYFIPSAFTSEVSTTRKVALTLCMVVGCILALLAIISDAKTRGGLAKSIMWLLVLGVMVCLQSAKTFIYIMAIVSIIDELFIVRLKDKYKTAHIANKEIDRRQ